jgi:hypothetical protein
VECLNFEEKLGAGGLPMGNEWIMGGREWGADKASGGVNGESVGASDTSAVEQTVSDYYYYYYY